MVQGVALVEQGVVKAARARASSAASTRSARSVSGCGARLGSIRWGV
jgi:hypothetical protein